MYMRRQFRVSEVLIEGQAASTSQPLWKLWRRDISHSPAASRPAIPRFSSTYPSRCTLSYRGTLDVSSKRFYQSTTSGYVVTIGTNATGTCGVAMLAKTSAPTQARRPRAFLGDKLTYQTTRCQIPKA